MRTATITHNINLFNLNELSEDAKEKAIEEHRVFLLSVMNPKDFISGDPEYDTDEKINEAYDREYEYYSVHDEPIIESIEINDYLFYSDGTLAPCVTYCCGEKRGKRF